VTPVVNAPVADFTTKTPLASEQNVLMQYDMDYPTPDYVYYKGVNTKWASFYRAFAGNYLLSWIKTRDNSWNVVARTPVGSWVPEVVYVPVNGDLTVTSISPSGLTDSKNYHGVTPGYRYLWFYAGAPGTYASVFNIGGVKSNQITLYAY
jgi:hypothetical protein